MKFGFGEFELQGSHILCILANGCTARYWTGNISKPATCIELWVPVRRKLKVWPFRWRSPFGDYWPHFLNFCHFFRRHYVLFTSDRCGHRYFAKCEMWTSILSMLCERRRLTKPWNLMESLYLVIIIITEHFRTCKKLCSFKLFYVYMYQISCTVVAYYMMTYLWHLAA